MAVVSAVYSDPEDRPKERDLKVTFEYVLAVERSLHEESPEDVDASVHRLMTRRFEKELREVMEAARGA